MAKIAVLAHIYYDDSWSQMKEYFFNILHFNTMFLINTCSQEVASEIRKDLPQATILVSENGGRDIAGILILIDYYIKNNLYSDYMVIVHDKITDLDIENMEIAGLTKFEFSRSWRDELLIIMESQTIPVILERFKDPKIGLVANSALIFDRVDNCGYYPLQTYCNRFGLSNLEKGNKLQGTFVSDPKFLYVAGTMFWVRSSIYKDFFSRVNPMEIREDVIANFAYGFVMERMFCFLATDAGYTISGIDFNE
jgi:lipopolysaccharide biosynthesis protein